MNLTQLEQLGQEWDSEVLLQVYDGLTSSSTDANVGALMGNRMFFANDYMASCFKVSCSIFLPLINRFSAVMATSPR